MTGRTLVVTNDFPPRTGGIESFVLAMVARMDPASVVVHTARQRGDAAFDARLPFPVHRDPSSRLVPTPALGRRAAELARAEGCQSVWFGAAAPLALLAPALRGGGVRRIVATTHGHEVWWARTPGTRALLHQMGEQVDVLTYLGDYTRGRIARALSPAARRRMVQLTPGVDIAAFRPGAGGAAVRQQLGLRDRPVVVCVSRLVARKGQDRLIQALPLIRARVPDVVLMVVGDGPARPRLERLVDTLGLRSCVVFTGARPWAQLPPYYDAGDVFCMPTRTRKAGWEVEGLGIVYLEASATGLPVVAGSSGGAPDAVLEGETGHVVDGGSPRDIAARVVELLENPEEAARMGRRGRRWVEERWGWDGLAQRLRALLRDERARQE
jgi:phosphatidylinositol alpha-1,6-mannosyltransferase